MFLHTKSTTGKDCSTHRALHRTEGEKPSGLEKFLAYPFFKLILGAFVIVYTHIRDCSDEPRSLRKRRPSNNFASVRLFFSFKETMCINKVRKNFILFSRCSGALLVNLSPQRRWRIYYCLIKKLSSIQICHGEKHDSSVEYLQCDTILR